MRTCPQCQHNYPDNVDFCTIDKSSLPAARASDSELAGGLKSRYRIVKRLGEGGMGTVFLAEQIALGNRPVALKVLLRRLLADPEFFERFQNEAASTARIRHPNVVTVYESGQSEDGTPYLAMEYLEGVTLSHVLRARGALPLDECAEILEQAARGLHAAHRLGIIHRDLKPDNVFLIRPDEGERLVKVLDFGIAKLADSPTHTLTGMVLGTPAYMSAEHAAGMSGDQLDARSDIYSLGVVAYEMLTGRVPFQSDTPLGFIRMHILEAPPRFEAVRGDLRLPKQLEQVVMKALQKDREKRYSSAIDFAREFAEAAKPPRPAATASPALQASSAQLQPPAKTAAPPSSSASLSNQAGLPVPRPPTKPAAAILTPPEKLTEVTSTVVAPTATARLERPTAATAARQPVAAALRRAKPRPVLAPVSAIVIGVGVLLLVLAADLWYHASKLPADMVYIPGGTFTMGCDNDRDPTGSPPHSATLAPFYLDKTPVTNARFLEFVRATGYAAPSGWLQGTYPAGQEKWPVTGVSWAGAQAYAKWKAKRLPTEAEWEFAARGIDGRIYPWGENFNPSLTNSVERGLRHPEPVASHPEAASPFGVLDMSGNVWEWCDDAYKVYAGNQMKLETPANAKVIRGGSFASDRNHVTVVTRNLDVGTAQSPEIGFRCAKSP